MTTKMAREQGLRMAHGWTKDAEDAKAKAKAIRDLGFRAVVVCDNPGYYRESRDVYAEPKYFIAKSIEDLNARLSLVDSQRAKMKADYERTVEEFEKSVEENKQKLADLKAQLMEE